MGYRVLVDTALIVVMTAVLGWVESRWRHGSGEPEHERRERVTPRRSDERRLSTPGRRAA